MLRHRLFLILLCSFFPLLSSAQSAEEGIGAMDWIVGKWSISGGEQDSDGSFFKETGFNQCAYVSKARMIRCELSLITEEAGGRYKGKWASRSIITYFSYNNQTKQFLIRHIFPNRTHEHNFVALNNSVFQGKWVNKSSPIGGNLDARLRIEQLNKNTYVYSEFLKSQSSSFQEDFKLTGRRIE